MRNSNATSPLVVPMTKYEIMTLKLGPNGIVEGR